MKKPGTHFDQIPIEEVKKIADLEVKKIADLDVPKKETGRQGNVIVEPASSKTEPYSRWPGSFQTTP